MSECPINVDLISSDEYIGDSLTKINNNFSTLLSDACDLENRVDDRVNIRTFFYYGPNSASSATSGMDDNSASRPSDATIESFVNDVSQLNLPSISEPGDIAYVIYQKTGWYKQQDNYYRSGVGSVPFQRTVRVPVTRRIGICFSPGTQISTPEGNKNIEDLVVGDSVFSYDPATKEKKSARVIKTFKGHCKESQELSPLYVLQHEKGALEVTADHWVYTGDKESLFKAAKDLSVGDCFILESGQKSIIYSITKKEEYEYVYNLNVEKYHNFIANGVLTGDYQTDSYVSLNKGYKIIENSIATPDGFKTPDTINVGDIIYGFDPETLELVEQTITQKEFKTTQCVKITHEYGTITLPEQQKIFFNKEYIEAKNLKVGDLLTVLEDTEVYTPYYDIESKILDIKTGIVEEMPELTVGNSHNYIFNNIFVHNGGGGGRGTVTVWEPRVETYYVGYSWDANINDTYDYYAPIFVIYRLTADSSKQYVMDSGFPKYTRASTASTTNWNNPQLWSTY